MQFTTSATLLSTRSIFGAIEGAGVRGKARHGVPRQVDADPTNNTPGKDVPQEIHCTHPGAGGTMDDPAFTHDGFASLNYPVYYDQEDLTLLLLLLLLLPLLLLVIATLFLLLLSPLLLVVAVAGSS